MKYFRKSFGIWVPDRKLTDNRGFISALPGVLAGARRRTNATDPSFGSVVMLLHLNGNDGSTTFTDSSSKSNNGTANGDVQIDTAQYEFGGASCLFDGTGDFLSWTSNADFGFGTGDFTIEFWLRMSSLSRDSVIYDSRATVNGYFPTIFVTSAGVLTYYVNALARISSSAAAIAINEWYAVAISRVSGTTKMFIDGTQSGSNYTDSNNYAQSVLKLGRNGLATSVDLLGWLDEVRITKGVGRYSGTYTVATEEFPNS